MKFDITDAWVGYGVILVAATMFAFALQMAANLCAELRKIREAMRPDTLEDVLAQILVLHDRLEAIADGRRVDGDRVSAAVGELVE
jgi:hypothetical protein